MTPQRFQSTLPMRGVTELPADPLDVLPISIHTPHAGSDVGFRDDFYIDKISIHTPHAGSDKLANVLGMSNAISIHTPHAGSDPSGVLFVLHIGRISIHTPHAGSDMFLLSPAERTNSRFQSTLPMRGVTAILTKSFFYLLVKINK